MKFEYYKCINLNECNPGNNVMKIGTIYKSSEETCLYEDCYRLKDLGHWTKTQFKLATEYEYFIQEGIVIPVFNYNKLINILNFINNYGKN